VRGCTRGVQPVPAISLWPGSSLVANGKSPLWVDSCTDRGGSAPTHLLICVALKVQLCLIPVALRTCMHARHLCGSCLVLLAVCAFPVRRFRVSFHACMHAGRQAGRRTRRTGRARMGICTCPGRRAVSHWHTHTHLLERLQWQWGARPASG